MSERKEYLTRKKHNELKKELDFLKNTKRKEIAEQLEQAKAFGDLSENAEYHEARENQATTEERIYQLEIILKAAIIVSPHKSDTVDVGSTVTTKKQDADAPYKFQIVGSEEADGAAGKLSLNSPLGKKLMGRKKGDEFIFTTPAGEKVGYKITKIE